MMTTDENKPKWTKQATEKVLSALNRAGFVVRRVQSFRPTLEDLFLSAIEAPSIPGTFPVGAPTS